MNTKKEERSEKPEKNEKDTSQPQKPEASEEHRARGIDTAIKVALITALAGILVALIPILRDVINVQIGISATETREAKLTIVAKAVTPEQGPTSSATSTSLPTATITPTPSIMPSETPTPTETSTPTPTNTPTNTPISYRLYENFEGSSTQLTWWSPDSDVFQYAIKGDQSYGGSQSFWIQFDKSANGVPRPWTFIGAEVPSELRNFQWARSVEVWVYGQASLLLKLEDEKGHQANIDTQNATDPAGWTLLRFNYTGAADSIDLGSVKGLFFFPAPGDAAVSTVVIYFDNLALSARP